MNVFGNVEMFYFSCVFIFLIMYFIWIFFWKDVLFRIFCVFQKIIVGILVIIFVYYGVGMFIWVYVFGYVLWVNGYEVVVFIVWVIMIVGFIFSCKYIVIFVGVVLLVFFMVMVMEFNLFDLQIILFQFVLKLYWLMIYVVVIMSSYGFLGIFCIFGFVNMVFYLVRNQWNVVKLGVDMNIFIYVLEMNMIIGLFMLIIGMFFGGIWVNELWGCYWGWDLKEIWVFVFVLVYVIIFYLCFIFGFKGKFVFNVVLFWGYLVILFIFFGVNFIFVGFYFYVQGDGVVSLFGWVMVLIGVFVVLMVVVGLKYCSFKKK